MKADNADEKLELRRFVLEIRPSTMERRCLMTRLHIAIDFFSLVVAKASTMLTLFRQRKLS
jgi:hypothetical protein